MTAHDHINSSSPSMHPRQRRTRHCSIWACRWRRGASGQAGHHSGKRLWKSGNQNRGRASDWRWRIGGQHRPAGSNATARLASHRSHPLWHGRCAQPADGTCRRCLHRDRREGRHDFWSLPGLAAQATTSSSHWLRWMVQRITVEPPGRKAELTYSGLGFNDGAWGPTSQSGPSSMKTVVSLPWILNYWWTSLSVMCRGADCGVSEVNRAECGHWTKPLRGRCSPN